MKKTESNNNAYKSGANPYHESFRCRDIKIPKRVGLFTATLTVSLMLTAGIVQADSGLLFLTANSGLENTERNVRDSDNTTLTPEDQKETKSDIKMTATIRKAVVKNKSLSLDAHNAKIITRNGVVTLRGPVENVAEKNKLQSIAEKTRGVKQVNNQLEPKTP
jgi:hyperosmotically inducible protein